MTDLTEYDTVNERSLVRVLIADSATGEVLVLKRGGNETFGVGLWEILQGSRDQGETPTEAAYREIHEEIGIHAEMLVESGHAVISPVSDDAFAIAHNDGFAEDWSNYNYLLIGTRLREKLGELTIDADHDEYAWVTLAKAKELLGDSTYSLAGQRLLDLMVDLTERFKRLGEHMYYFHLTNKMANPPAKPASFDTILGE